MRKIIWIFGILIGFGALFFGCTPGIIPVQPATIPNLPNPLLVYDGAHGQLEAPVSIQIFADYGPGNSSGTPVGASGCPVSVLINYQDTTIPYAGNKFCMSMAVYSYTNNCESFATFAFRTIKLAPTDYSSGNFSTATFYARSVPATSISFAFLSANGPTLNLTTDWALYTVPLPSPASVTGVNAIMEVGGGAGLGTVPAPYTVYIDQVQFQ